MPLARQVLDILQRLYENGEPLEIGKGLRLYQVRTKDYHDAKKLYAIFSNFEDYSIRVQSFSLSIYSKDRPWILNIANSIHSDNVISFWEPNNNYLSLLEKNTILVSEDTGYQFKVTFGNKKGESSFAKWAVSNPKQIRLGPVCKETLENEGYVSGMYFYARDDKTLQLCSLMTNNIRRIDKLIVKSDIDK